VLNGKGGCVSVEELSSRHGEFQKSAVVIISGLKAGVDAAEAFVDDTAGE